MRHFGFVILLAAMSVSGCVPSSAREMQANPRYLYKTYHLSVSLKKINAAFAGWSRECMPHRGLSMDPEDPTKGRIVWTQTAYINGMMVFTENPPGATRVDTYSGVGVTAAPIRDAIAVSKGSIDCSLAPLGAGVYAASGGAGAGVLIVPVLAP